MCLRSRLITLVSGLAVLSTAPLALAQPGAAASFTAEPVPTDQIIVRFKAPSETARAAAQTGQEMAQLSQRANVSVRVKRQSSLPGTYVLKLPEKMSPAAASAVARALANDPEVAYAEPDLIMQPTRVPVDVRFDEQWHYQDSPGGIRLPPAWEHTTGSNKVTVAVVDSGVLYDHPDLQGRLLPGYDFVSLNDGRPVMANDGDGRDPDASDPGDWVTADEDAGPGVLQGCGVSNSSWHGTHVAGTIGAASDNALGGAGVSWGARLLPVRVLGKCGGYLSDVVDGMRWAAGLSVPEAPANPNPARILNLSFGGFGACSRTYQSAISDIMARGAVIVAAAGNSASDVSGEQPANCSGVIAVAATNKSGGRASYTNTGSQVAISAPGGDSEGGVLSTSNTGRKTPEAPDYRALAGTSMAAPHVSGVIALMLSLKDTLNSSEIRTILQTTARPFPTGTGRDCRTGLCGAGIVDADAAVAHVVRALAPPDKPATPPPAPSPAPAPTTAPAPATDGIIKTGGGGGCKVSNDRPFDPVLVLLPLLAGWQIWRRQRRSMMRHG